MASAYLSTFGYKQRKSEKRKTTGVGWIYVITNPAWPAYCKIGRTTNLPGRHRTFQTASPHRDFELRFSRRFADVCLAERALKKSLPGFRAKGEWHLLHADDATILINNLGD